MERHRINKTEEQHGKDDRYGRAAQTPPDQRLDYDRLPSAGTASDAQGLLSLLPRLRQGAEHYDVYKYDNDFPALSPCPPQPDPVATSFFETAPAYGKCEVILYSPEHTVTLPELPADHIKKLVDLWAQRFTVLSADENIRVCVYL